MPAESTSITAEHTVDEVVSRFPSVARVFVQRRMHCVGCDLAPFETLRDACRVYGQPLEAVLVELRAAAAGSARPADRQLAPAQGRGRGRRVQPAPEHTQPS